MSQRLLRQLQLQLHSSTAPQLHSSTAPPKLYHASIISLSGTRSLSNLFLALFCATPAFLLYLPTPAAAAPSGPVHAAAKPGVKSDEISLNCPARFITAMVPDGHGGVWVAGEDTGIYHGNIRVTDQRGNSTSEPMGLSPRAGKLQIRASWTAFNKSNSPGLVSDSITALCVDGKGRLWAGTNRHGVCVFNGHKWRHYGLLTGPLGSHVMAIANDPRDGSVWMCTENGLGIYTPRRGGTESWLRRLPHAATLAATPLICGRWRYISRLNGLPANPDCVAFDKQGTAFVGTLCGGLAIAAYPYSHWRVVHGPWHLPLSPTGIGLPGNLINCVLVGRHGKIYVGTDRGLAISTDNGQTFRYERGMDFAAKVQGLWHPPANFTAPPKAFLNHLLPGDHITCLAQGSNGNIWLVTWRSGYAKIDTRTGKIIQSQFINGLSQLDPYVSKIAFLPGGSLIVGRYGYGVSALKLPRATASLALRSRPHGRKLNAGLPLPDTYYPLPQPAKAPGEMTLASFTRTLRRADRQGAHIHYPFARFLRNDWRTQGDWTARYGKEYAVLCAAHFDLSFHCIAPDYATNVDAFCGPHHRWPFESMREWESKADTVNPKSLYIPQLGYRRQTNWDDHGETYPTTFQGPDLWIRVHLKKPGIYRLSLYLFNKDGHYLYNRQRDWLVEVYPLPPAYCQAMTRPILSAMVFPKNPAAQQWANWAMAATPLAETRAVNIWNPVYTRFAIAGPGQYMVRIVRGSSLNTEISGIFIDKADAKPTPFDNQPMPCLWGVNYRAPEVPIAYTPNANALAAISVWRMAQRAFGNIGFAARWPARILAYRAAAANKAPAKLLARWRWRLDIWKREDRKVFDATMNKAFHAMLKQWKGLKQFMAKDHDLQPNSGELGNGKPRNG